MKIFRLALRLIIGALFVGHGTHKLFGWFGGRGLKGTAEAFERMGLRPSMPNAIAAGVSETGGGVLVAAGFLTPLGASMIMGSMFTAIHRVHGKNGPWVTDGGYEYNLVLIASLAMLVEAGPGAVSIDAIKGQEREGTLWALTSLLVGGLGAVGRHLISAAVAPPEPPAPPAPPEPPAPSEPPEQPEPPAAPAQP